MILYNYFKELCGYILFHFALFTLFLSSLFSQISGMEGTRVKSSKLVTDEGIKYKMLLCQDGAPRRWSD